MNRTYPPLVTNIGLTEKSHYLVLDRLITLSRLCLGYIADIVYSIKCIRYSEVNQLLLDLLRKFYRYALTNSTDREYWP